MLVLSTSAWTARPRCGQPGWLLSTDWRSTVAPEWDQRILGNSTCRLSDPHAATDHLQSQGQVSGTACLRDPFTVQSRIQETAKDLTCLDDDRGATAFELAPEKCTYTYLLTYLGQSQKFGPKSGRGDTMTLRTLTSSIWRMVHRDAAAHVIILNYYVDNNCWFVNQATLFQRFSFVRKITSQNASHNMRS